MKPPEVDIAVIGGGLIGSLFSLAAAKSGFTVGLIDAVTGYGDRSAFDGRAYALSQASCRMLAALGFRELLHRRSQEIEAIQITDGRAGEGAGPFKLRLESAECGIGPMGRMIEDRFLRGALTEAVAGCTGIRLLSTEVRAVAFENGHARPEINGGLSCSLVAGCDGRNSVVAASAGIRYSVREYSQSAIVCAVEHGQPHAATAHQFFMPNGPLAILPLQGNISSLVWTTTHAEARHLSELDSDGFLAELRPRFGSFLGELGLVGSRARFPLSLTRAESFTATRAALLGEAATALHPLAGQGLNLGFRDAASLTETLTAARRRGEDIGEPAVLERYQSWRRLDATLFAGATDGFNRLFSSDNPLLRTTRGLGMAAVDHLPHLRRRLIREAAGLTGTLPSLLVGPPV
ncbi:MAG: UbiH/UbiF/VisC/COQ6 family ubiquinone biosynthesis hydroxylase [Rhodobacteraceae bacterium]|nr:UbiH/UbiF/VisC/COQ6 family ubiquinone biosynthesis hydroxylase [Paracoccaceae bacterium]